MEMKLASSDKSRRMCMQFMHRYIYKCGLNDIDHSIKFWLGVLKYKEQQAECFWTPARPSHKYGPSKTLKTKCAN